MITTEKHAKVDWDIYRKNLRKSTPIDLSETVQQKKTRKDKLEDNPEEWKRYYFQRFFKYISPEFHKKASLRLIKNFLKFRHWYEVRNWVRGLSKTTLTMMDVLYLVMTGKLKNIIYTSATWDAAAAFLNRYQSQLDSNQRLINDYGKQALPGSWSEGDFTTRSGVKFLALGAGQTPRGNGNDEIRPDCIIVDDFDTDEDCRNPDTITKHWDWFQRALFFAVDTAEPYLVIWLGNIIAEDCCVKRAREYADYAETINIRDENGKSTWPQKNSEADIDYQLSKVSYEASQAEMFNNPMRQGQTFKEMTYGKCPPLKQLQFAMVYADPSPSNKDKPSIRSGAQNSCKAVVILGYLSPNYYLYKCWVDTTTNSNFIDWLFAAKNYVGSNTQLYIFIENNTLQNPHYEQVLLPLIFQKAKEYGTDLPITPDGTDKPDKWFRIEGTLEPIVRQGQLIFNETEKENPHMKRMEAQFKAASATSKTLDGPDSIQGGIKLIKDKITVESAGSVKSIKRPTNTKRY